MANLPRVYKVFVEFDTYVLAHSPEEAADFARLDTDCREDLDITGTAVAVKAVSVPSDDAGSYPWIALDVKDPDHHEDCTVGEWLERIAEEEADLRRVAEFNAKQLDLPGVL
jgi:hypothetical protein